MEKYKITLFENGKKIAHEIFADNYTEAYLRANQFLIPYNNTVTIHSIVKADSNLNYNISEAV